MALNFPNSPTDGQQWTDSNGQTWVYNLGNNSWTALGAPSGGMVYRGGIDITSAPPAGVKSGWLYSVTTGGTANAGFTGLTGTIIVGTQVVYDGTGWQVVGTAGPWNRAGTELSPVNAGDSVFTSGAVKVGGTTAAPNLQLKADGGIVANTDGLVYDSANKRLGVGTSAPQNLIHAHTAGSNTNAIQLTNSTTGTGAGDGMQIVASDSEMQIRNRENGVLNFWTNNTKAVTIDTSQRVGIGTTSPGTYKLNIDGPYDSDGLRVFAGASGYGTPLVVGRASGGEALRVDNGGRLLVGTSTSRNVGSSGATLLQLESTSYRFFSTVQNSNDAFGSQLYLGKSRGTTVGSSTAIQSGDEIGYIGFAAADGTDVESACAAISAVIDGTTGSNDVPGRLVFSTTASGSATPTERLRISSDGSATFAGGVTQGAETTWGSGNQNDDTKYYMYAGSDGSSYAEILIQNASNSTRNPFTVYRGKASDSNNQVIMFTADGSATFAGNITAPNVTSDARFKTNLAPASSQLDDIKQLSALLKNWDWNDDAPMNEEIRSQRFLGLVAQEAEKVCPHISYTVPRTKQGKELTPAVFEDRPDPEDEENFISVEVQPATYEELDDSYKALKHDVILMKLLGTVGELIAKNEALEAKVTALQGGPAKLDDAGSKER